MKRDMDLIRAILLEAESASADQAVARMEGWSDSDFAYNVDLMKQAGLVEAAVAKASGGIPVTARVYSLTWEGHDLLDSIRDETVWNRTKAALVDTAGTAGLEIVKALAVSITRAALGLPPA